MRPPPSFTCPTAKPWWSPRGAVGSRSSKRKAAPLRWAFDRPGLVKSLTVSPDGKEMAITFDSEPTERWDLTKTSPAALGELLPRDVVQYSPDGQTLVLGTGSGSAGVPTANCPAAVQDRSGDVYRPNT